MSSLFLSFVFIVCLYLLTISIKSKGLKRMTPVQLYEFLKTSIHANLNVLITSPPGCGKTAIVNQVCAEEQADLVPMFPAISDPTDFKGFPFIVSGNAVFLPFGDLKLLKEAKKRTICFLDDLGQASISVQAACMQLLHAKYNVSKHVSFFAATNRREDKAGVAGLLEPVKSRFSTIVSLEPNANDLANWGFKNNMHHDVLSFILYRPALVLDFKPVFEMKNSPCPRTIFNLSECHKLSLPEDQAFEVYKGAVGEGFATEFLGFLELKSQLPNMNTVLTDPSNAKIPTDPGILYVFIGQLAYRASQTNMTNIIKLANRIDPEFGMVLMTIIGQRSKKLLEHPEAVAYLSKINNAYA